MSDTDFLVSDTDFLDTDFLDTWYFQGGSPWNQVEEKPLKSPFPGMDPYIEACGLWEDFHSHLIEKIGEKLADAAPDRYLVRTGERSYIVLLESEGMKSYSFRPDVSVTRSRGRTKAAKKGGTALAVPTGESEPLTLRPFIQEEHREAFVEIYEANPGQRLVTSIEVLSPSNKRPERRDGSCTSASGKVSCSAM